MDDQQTKILLAMRKITEAVMACRDQDEIVTLLVQQIRQTMHVDCCSLYICDEKTRRYRLAATDGLVQEAVGKAGLKFGEGLVGAVGERRALLNLADAPAHPNFKYLPDVGEDEFHSFMGVPVLYQGQLFGIVVIQTKEQRQFSDAEESFMVTLAAQLANGLLKTHAASVHNRQIRSFHGTSGAGELAIGQAMIWQSSVDIDKVRVLHCDDPSMQQELFQQTILQLQIEMDKTALRMQEDDKNDAAAWYLQGYGKMVDDREFQNEVVSHILSEGLLASSAIKQVYDKRVAQVHARNADEKCLEIRDFAQVLISRLVHASPTELNTTTEVILVVENLSATLIAELPKEHISGFVATQQHSSSHAIILARDLGLPVVIGADLDIDEIDGRTLIIDGEKATGLIDPPQSVVDEFAQLISQTRAQLDIYSREIAAETSTIDGRRIGIRLNAGLSGGEDDSIEDKVDGVGLYRTEIAFMLTQSFPSEQQQFEWYSALLSRFSHSRVCMRTLDVGSDKALSYLPISESNPAMGWRGVRVTIDHPQIMRTQLRAMLRASQAHGNLDIMLPMVSSLEEVAAARAMLTELAAELAAENGSELSMPRFGVMIEVPSLVYMLDELAASVDFLSIGSNDLVQYLLAVDANNPLVERFYTPFHPAVIRCLSYIKRKCAELGKQVAVCGEIAGKPMGALMLLSLGYDELSLNYADIARIKYIIRRISCADLQQIGEQARQLGSCSELRSLYEDYAVRNGLSRLMETASQQAAGLQLS